MGRSKEVLKVKGFVRTQIVDEDGRIAGDSGFVENTVVNLGFQDYIVGALGGIAGSKQVSHMAIGTGTAPGAAATSLDGETGTRVTTSNSAVSSKTLQCTCQFAGSDMGSTLIVGVEAVVTLLKKLSQIRWTPRTGNTEPSLEKGRCNDLTGRLSVLSEMKVKSELLQECREINRNDLSLAICKSNKFGTIQNVALINSSATGTILCGTTYTTSQWASNQNVRYLRQVMVTLLRKLSQIRWISRTDNTEPSLRIEKGRCNDLTGRLSVLSEMKVKSELCRNTKNGKETIPSLCLAT